MVEVDYLGETKVFSPQEVSSMVLTKVCDFTPQFTTGVLIYFPCR